MPMTFDCQSDAVASILRRLESAALKGGCRFADDIVIRERDGDLWVETHQRRTAPGPLMFITAQCLSPLHDVGFRLANDQVVIHALPDHWSDGMGENLELMIALYNETGKLSRFRETHPIAGLLDHMPVLERLMAARPAGWFRNVKDGVGEYGADRVCFKTFLSSRASNFTQPGDQTAAPHLLNFADLINHHLLGARYDIGSEGLRIQGAQPRADSLECFTRYGQYDAMGSFLTYGFADTHADFVSVVPMDLEVEGLGTITVQGRSSKFTAPLAPGNEDLRPYLPDIQVTDNRVLLSKLIIPPKTVPGTLTRVLRAVTLKIQTDRGMAPRPELALDMESQVVARTQAFYSSLKAYLTRDEAAAAAPAPLVAEAVKAVSTMLSVLEAHRVSR